MYLLDPIEGSFHGLILCCIGYCEFLFTLQLIANTLRQCFMEVVTRFVNFTIPVTSVTG